MPCTSYDDRPDYSERDWKNKTDRLARIACKALQALEDAGKEDFLLLQDDEVREWWEAHKIADRRAQEARAEKARIAQVRRAALAKLTDEERRALGIKQIKSTNV